jgi:hypothetical protein
MAVWLVRSEKKVERRQFALENNIAVLGRNESPGVPMANFPLKRFWALLLED